MDCGRCGLELPGTSIENGEPVWWDGDEVKCADCESVNRISVSFDETDDGRELAEGYVQGWTCRHGTDDETACEKCIMEDEDGMVIAGDRGPP